MKATGIVRKVDDLGRIVLPIDVRRERGIEPKDDVEIYVDGDNIVLQKYRPHCVFCGGQEDLIEFQGKRVCLSCAEDVGGDFGHAAD